MQNGATHMMAGAGGMLAGVIAGGTPSWIAVFCTGVVVLIFGLGMYIGSYKRGE